MKLENLLKTIRFFICVYALYVAFGTLVFIMGNVFNINFLSSLKILGLSVSDPIFFSSENYLEWVQLSESKWLMFVVVLTGFLSAVFYWMIGMLVVDFKSLQSISQSTLRRIKRCMMIWVLVLLINVLCVYTLGFNKIEFNDESIIEDSKTTRHWSTIQTADVLGVLKRSQTKTKTQVKEEVIKNQLDQDPSQVKVKVKRTSNVNFYFGTTDSGGFLSLILCIFLFSLCRHLLAKAKIAESEREIINEAHLTV